MRGRNTVIVVVIAALLVLVFMGILTYANRPEQPNGGLVREVVASRHPVQTVVVSPLDLVETLDSTGVLQAEQDVVVTSEVAGKVERVYRKLGDRCNKGQLLVRLDAEGYEIALAQAKAALKQSEVGLDHASRDWKRMEALQESAVVTAQQLDAAEGAMSAQAAGVEQARAAQRLATKNLAETGVRCPFNGYVAEMHVDTGSAVMPQTPVARLVDTSLLSLVLGVTTADIGRLRRGQLVRIKDPSLPNQVFEGSVKRLGVAADSRTRTFPVEVEVAPFEGALRAGQVVHVSLELQVFENVIAVPNQSISKDPLTGAAEVLVIEGGKAKRQMVTVGPQIDELVILTSGIKSGDEVVTVGGSDLENGFPVEVRSRITQTGRMGHAKEKTAPASEKTPSR